MNSTTLAIYAERIARGQCCPVCSARWHTYPDGSGTMVHRDGCEYVKASDAEAIAAYTE
jgi:hypothetical protein